MDQLASIAGRGDGALLIDCRNLSVELVPLPPSLAVLVVQSGLSRALADSAYAERRATCEAAAERLGLRALRDATADQVADDPRARHVVSENERVLAAAVALRGGDVHALGRLLSESHASLRDDFDVSTPELDALVQALIAAGALGARLTGAGFGGCVVALALEEDADRVSADACERYRRLTGLEPKPFRVRAVAGAGPAEAPSPGSQSEISAPRGPRRQAGPDHGAASRRSGALPCGCARERRHSVCWSKQEREQWERERREAELEAERIRLVSATHKTAEPEPEVQFDEREEELVRA
jgi:hypothetical protein